MYCPSCSFNNQGETKFCTRCGTNLAVVADALSGATTAPSQLDERMVTLFKDYYRGRNAMIIGGAAFGIALFKVVLFALFGLPAATGFLGTLAGILMAYGVICLIWGLGKWNDSTSEIKAIQRTLTRPAAAGAIEDRAGQVSTEPAALRSGSRNTDPIKELAEYQGSVTEHTTRQLEDNAAASLLEKRPKNVE